MSDRCVFAGYKLGTDYDWADVVVGIDDGIPQIHEAAQRFTAMPGPHKVFVSSREDPRFIEFVRHLSEEHAMEEGASWGFAVYVEEGHV